MVSLWWRKGVSKAVPSCKDPFEKLNDDHLPSSSLGQLRGQDYPKDRFEILVADGMSDDGTRDIG